MEQQSSKTIRKVKAASAGSAAGAIVVILVWWLSTKGAEIPANVKDALELLLGLVLTGGIPALSAWASGYYTRPSENDIPVKK